MTTEGKSTLDIVFDGPPGAVAGRFVEVENGEGQSVSVGQWLQRPDGYWVLRLDADAALSTMLAELDEERKKLADARAEYMLVESALVDAMGALQFYADEDDGGRRAEALLKRLFERLIDFARVQKLKDQ